MHCVTIGYDVHSSVQSQIIYICNILSLKILFESFLAAEGLVNMLFVFFSPLADSQIRLKRLPPANDLTLTRAKVPSLEQKGVSAESQREHIG